jgi:uncharacterized membrane protein
MVAVLMLGSLLITWTSVYTSATVIPVILNKGFITGLAASVALLIYFLLLRKEKDEFYINTVRNRSVKESMLFASILVAYLAGALEIYYQFDTRFYTETSVYIIYFQLYSFAAALLLIKIFKRASFGDLLRIILTLLCLGLYVFNLVSNSLVSFALLNGTRTLFIGHWFAAILLLWLLLDLSQFFFRVKNERWKSYRPTFTWVTTMAMVLLLSIELYHIILWTNYGNDWQWWENLYYKAGLTILWGICSFTMMWLGMKLSFRELRIISLSLFSLTIIKLFLYDIRNIPPGGKIAAFILLGVLLLTVSFMYQRLKKIIIEDTAG